MHQPKPYQTDGIAFLRPRAAAFLADDAGLGKSMQLIQSANQEGLGRVMVVCPAIGRVSWELQLAEWDETSRPVLMLLKDLGRGERFPDGPLAVIVAMDWLSQKGRKDQITRQLGRSERFDAVFIDEGHYLKTPSAARTKAVYGAKLDRGPNSVTHFADRVWVATATPTPLNVGELYPHLRALFPDTLEKLFGKQPTLFEFQSRYCDMRSNGFGVKPVGNNKTTVPELRKALKPNIIMRRKADVLKDLPPITTVLMPLEVADKATIKSASEAWADDMIDADDATFMAALARAYNEPEYSTRRREMGVLKSKAAQPWIADFLSADFSRKLVVFAHHRDVLTHLLLKNEAFGAVAIHGGTPPGQKPGIVDRFMVDKACRLFLGQTRAAGTSITLTSASTVLILEPDPSPDNNYQAISRCHRLGQQGNVVAHFAYTASNPIERRQAQVLRRRAGDNQQLFGGEARGFTPNK